MKAIDLKKALAPYESGWVAIRKKDNKVIAHAEKYTSIIKKVKGEDILLVPASKEYFGFITTINA